MTRGKTPSPAASLHEQTVRHHCRALKMPTVAGQFETLAQAAIREGHGHVQYLDALLTAEIEERERKGVVRRIQEAHLPRVKTLAEFDFRCKGRMKLPQMWRVNNPQTVCQVIDRCLSEWRSFSVVVPGGVVEVARC
jgi:DNA replication protein DnaC